MKPFYFVMLSFTYTANFLFLKSFAYGCDGGDLMFPKGMLIGVGTSAYQVEGAWNISDKGESVWDRFTHTKPHKISDASNGDVTCDSYHKYREDVKMLRWLGVNVYRFSISWTRILPTGYANVISKDGIRYYNALINELLMYNITPIVTLYHWDHPQVFLEMGGWTNEVMVDLFGDYVKIIFQEFGDRVKFWTTVNEPNVICQFTYSFGFLPPNVILGKYAEYLCTHNVLKAHARAYHIYDDEFRARQNGKIGIVMNIVSYFPKIKNDHTSADIAFQFQCGIYAHPIFSKTGDYPAIVKQRIAENSKFEGLQSSRLPTFTKEWIDYIKGTSDYLGLNYYDTMLAEPGAKSNHTIYVNDSGIAESIDERPVAANLEKLRLKPDALLSLLLKISQVYNNPPIYIMENGMSDDSTFDDRERIEFLYVHMKSTLRAINEYKCDVRSYIVWSLMDNWEWIFGHTKHFGLFRVNFTSPNRERSPKASAYWFKDVLRARKLLPKPPKHFESIVSKLFFYFKKYLCI